MLEMNIFVNQAIYLTLAEALECFNILMTHSGMGRDVTQRVSVVAMLILLLGLGSIFLMKQIRICANTGINNEDTPIWLLDIYVQ